MVGAMTFFISLELDGLNQFPVTERSTKSLRRKFPISWAEFACTLLDAVLSGFVNASDEQAFSLEPYTCT